MRCNICAIFGVVNHPDASRVVSLGLHALQHRGQEGWGIMSTDGHQHHLHKSAGLLGEGCSEAVVAGLRGHAGIGHTRYSTTKGGAEADLHPFFARTTSGWLGVVHNGNLVNAATLTDHLLESGAALHGHSDTECILHLITRHGELPESIFRAAPMMIGAYSLLILTPQAMYAVRDPHGFRPLCLGQLGDGWVLSSETTALDLVGADFVRHIRPGEVLTVPLDGRLPSSQMLRESGEYRPCAFEWIYFARPDTTLENCTSVYDRRKMFGASLAEEHPAQADIVIPVPDSGVPAAIGFSQKSGIPFEMALVRSHYAGRSFLLPSQGQRVNAVKMKLSPVLSSIRNRRVAVIDDSIVRGTTMSQVIALLRQGNPAEIHLRISSPPVRFPCYYGIDMPDRASLISSQQDEEQLARTLGVKTVRFLSQEAVKRVLGMANPCMACFDGKYIHEETLRSGQREMARTCSGVVDDVGHRG